MKQPSNAEIREIHNEEDSIGVSIGDEQKHYHRGVLLNRLEAASQFAAFLCLEFYSGEIADGCPDTETRLLVAKELKSMLEKS